MIFVTVGSQLPFDRLVRAVDDWAAGNGGAAAFAQIGASSYLVPADQGLTAGATAQGPATTPVVTPAGGPAVPTTTATVGATR